MYRHLLKKSHVEAALKYIDKNGIPSGRIGKKYTLLSDGKAYPPKYVLTVAIKLATGIELIPDQLNGGRQTNSILESLGFLLANDEKTARVVRLVLKKEYDVFNSDNKLSDSFTHLAYKIKNLDPFDFMVTPGGFSHYEWPDIFENVLTQAEGSKNLAFFEKQAAENFYLFWKRLPAATWHLHSLHYACGITGSENGNLL